MNWSTHIAAELQRPMIAPPLPRRAMARPALDSILTPWGWKPARAAKKASRLGRTARKAAAIPFERLETREYLKPWGW